MEFGAKGRQRPGALLCPASHHGPRVMEFSMCRKRQWPEGHGVQYVQKETKEEKRNCVSESQLFFFFLRNKPH